MRMKRENNLNNFEDADIIPVDEISLMLSLQIDQVILQTKYIVDNMPDEYNQAIERSLFKYFPDVITYLPENLGQLRETSVFRKAVDSYINFWSKRTKNKLYLPPRNQVILLGDVDGVACYKVHIANTLWDELFICDIFLQNPSAPNELSQTGEGYKGLGHGFFDRILCNIEIYAKNNGYQSLGLIASNKENMLLFSRRGFCIEETHLGERAKQYEMGYPMIKKL